MKKLEKKDYLLLLTIISIVVGFTIYLSIKGFIFGSEVDWANQHIVLPEYFRNLFYKNGKIIPSFALNLGMGQNIFNFSYYGLLSPLILVSYLLPFIPMYIFIPVLSIVMLVISIIMFYKWIKTKYNSKIAFITSFIFALNAPFFYHFHRHIMFVIYMPFMIGALKSVDLYFETKKPIPLIIYTFLLILTNYYFSVSGIITIGIYTIYKLLKNKQFSHKTLWKIIYYVTISILLASVLLLPTMYALINGRIETLTSTTLHLKDLINPINNYKYTFYNSYYSWGVTIIYIISIISGLLSKQKNQIFLSGLMGLFIVFPICSYILNGFMYIDGKCFIPFLPVALLTISEFLNNLNNKKVNLKKLMYISCPASLLIIYTGLKSNNIYLLLADIFLITIALLINTKKHKPFLIYIPVILTSFATFIISSNNENYMSVNKLKIINNEAYSKLLESINDNNIYRTSNEDYILYNPNKVYDTNELKTSIYSSLSNKYYMNFIRNIFQNEVINRDNTTVTQTSNVLFNIYSNTKYLITSKNPPIGYTKINETDNIGLYQNDSVLPLAYSSNKIMSLREFNTLTYPYTIDALLNYIIVDKSLDNVYKTNIKEYKSSYKITEINNIKYTLENGHYIIDADKNANLKIKLNEKINNKVLIISFKMNKAKEGFACSSNITINGITNALSCSNWKYNNQNNTFEYVLSSNEELKTLNISLTEGEFDISDIKVYTMDYNKIKNIKNNISEMVINKVKLEDNHIVGTINAKVDGYVKITIPYDDGFKLYLDGERVGKVLIDDCFLGLEITKGSHTIDIIYEPPLLKTGAVISLIGVLLLILVIFYPKLENKFNKIKNYLNKIFNKIKKTIINFTKFNKGYIYLFLSLYILDLALRIFYNKQINFYHWFFPVPNLFSILWILLILRLTKLLKNKIGKTLYIISYIISIALFLTHAIYFSYFKIFFDFSVLSVAGEGAAYLDSVLLNIKYWVVITVIASIILTVRGLKIIKFEKKINYKNIIITILVFILIHSLLPLALGKSSKELNWDEWRNARSIYRSFNDNNKSLMVSGMYEYNIRNLIMTYSKNKDTLTKEEENVLNANFESNISAKENDYTGAFKGKNLIIVQLESIDNFLLDKDIMPTFYKISQNSLNFVNHYSFTSGGGSTFNSEFMINTGYSTAYNYNMNAYSFSKNAYPYSLPNLLKNDGYESNVFHMNSGEYYSRKVNYKSFGYNDYYGLKDLNIYHDNEFWLDTELIKNETFNNKIFKNDKLSLSYIITYSAHMPFKTNKGTCQKLTNETGLTEFECLKLQAKETDDMIKLLFENLKENNQLDNTVVILVSDHYLYTLEDKTLLDKYKETSNNLINHTPFVIWSNGQIKKTIKDVNSQLDILPTILNLFGIEYNVNNYIGRDIFSKDFDPLVFFPDGSWYNGSTYVANGEYQNGKKISNEKLQKYNNIVKNKMNLNDAVLKSNYFENK